MPARSHARLPGRPSRSTSPRSGWRSLALICLPLLACQVTSTEEEAPVTPTGTPRTPFPTPEPTPTDPPTPTPPSTCDWDGEDAAGPFTDDWWQDAVFYTVFLRSYQDSCAGSCAGTCDGIGDLPGLLSRLDHLNDGNPDSQTDLGVNGLLLMPIFPATATDGYNPTDYYSVAPAYGSLANLEALLADAHARGMKVLLDLPLNASAYDHPWFQSAAKAESAPYRDYYVWSASREGTGWYGEGGSYYWAGAGPLYPELNYQSPDLRSEVIDIMEFWLSKGVDGFRLDTVSNLVEEGRQTSNADENHCYLQGLRRYFAQHWPDRLLLGDVSGSTRVIGTYFGDGQNELALALDVPVMEGILDSVLQRDPLALRDVLLERAGEFPDSSMGAPLLSDAEHSRPGSLLAETPSQALAALIALGLPGPSFLYYGEEIGMTGLLGEDTDGFDPVRSPMQWSTASHAGFSDCSPWMPVNADANTINVSRALSDPDSVLHAYQKAIHVRLEQEPLRRGGFSYLLSNPGGTLAFLRQSQTGAVLAVYNLSDSPAEDVSVDLTGLGPWSQGLELISDTPIAGPVEDLFGLGTLPPQGVWWIALED